MAAERLAGAIRARADECGLSLRQVALRSRLALATVEVLASGTATSPRRETLVKLARGLDVPADTLLALAVEVPAARTAPEPLAQAVLRLRVQEPAKV
jgi:transcriptional regulator with XRE-family HTH domain